MTEPIESFAKRGYAPLRNLLPEAPRSFLYEYALKSAQKGRLTHGDPGVPDTPCSYSDVFMESLLKMLLPRVEAESGLRLYPTYSYFRVYKHGDVLRRHTDRPSCEISLTVNLGYIAAEPWPICIEIGGNVRSFSLEPGDALLYRGIDVPHWRDRFSGEQAAQVFLHYVDQNGPHRGWMYDKRGGLAISPIVEQILHQFSNL